MSEDKVYLKRDGTLYWDKKTNLIMNNETPVDITEKTYLGSFLYLTDHRDSFCSYKEIFENVCSEPYYSNSKSPVPDYIAHFKTQLLKKFKKNISFHSCLSKDTPVDFADYDITLVNTPKQGYTLYLGYYYQKKGEASDALESTRLRIAEKYYDEYRIFDWLNESKMNRSLMEVFISPGFSNNRKLNISESENTFISAPNGFGKSTLLQALLLVSNPSKALWENSATKKKAESLRKEFGIPEDFLTLFIDSKKMSEGNIFSNDEELNRWLLYATGIDKFISLEVFEKTVAHYNEKKRLILIFDGIDEIIKKGESGISKESVLSKIRLLTNADGICSNAKVIVSSRPLTHEKKMVNFDYLYMESLTSRPEIIETFIQNYAPDYAEAFSEYVFDDLYLKNFITTPSILVECMSQFLTEKYNEESGVTGNSKSKYEIIRGVIRNTMMRFHEKKFYNYGDKNYDQAYETLAYVLLFKNVENRPDDFAIIQNLVLENLIDNHESGKAPLTGKDIIDAYEHFCLINTQGRFIEFLAPKVIQPYYLANYMYKYYKNLSEEYDDEKNKWEMFESVSDNKLNDSKPLYDMLTFYFGIMHDGFTYGGIHRLDPRSAEYNAWVDYVIYKWNEGSCKEGLSDMLNYLLKSDFVEASRLKTILSEKDTPLQGKEPELVSIFKKII